MLFLVLLALLAVFGGGFLFGNAPTGKPGGWKVALGSLIAFTGCVGVLAICFPAK